MLAKNNGDPRQCAANLLKISRGENPFDRIKGLDSSLADSPADTAQYDTVAEVEYTLETYEPRIVVETVEFDTSAAQHGDFFSMAKIKLREEDDNE